MDHGSLIPDPEAQANRWAEYFEELLTPAPDSVDFSLLDSEEEVLSFGYLSNDDEPPSANVEGLRDWLREEEKENEVDEK